MNETDLQRLLMSLSMKKKIEVKETHISWIILMRRVVYKIKKTVRFSFLDYSTVTQRKKYCKEEVILNQRLTNGIYIGVVPIRHNKDNVFIGKRRGKVVDYAVQMKRLDSSKQMSVLLKKNTVKDESIRSIAKLLSDFHGRAKVIHHVFDWNNLLKEFNDIGSIKQIVRQQLSKSYEIVIDRAIACFDRYIEDHKEWLQTRFKEGYIRDCHGDLHSGNIFLYVKPVIFDCIEFNKEFRYIDVLSEIAFLSMDLEVYKRKRLSNLLVKYYCHYTGHILQTKEKELLLYYKLYRAGIRAKIITIELRQTHERQRSIELNKKLKGYLDLMQLYLVHMPSK